MNRHHRRSIRLRDYDYTQAGAYFVTICTHERRCILGHIVDAVMVPNTWGEIAQEEWDQTAVLRPNVELDAFVIMPNHIHGIIVISDPVGAQCIAPLQPPQIKHGVTQNNVASGSLGSIVRTFKAAVTRRLNRLDSAPARPFWQRNYHEYIIRDQDALNKIRSYIALNPLKWTDDSLYLP